MNDEIDIYSDTSEPRPAPKGPPRVNIDHRQLTGIAKAEGKPTTRWANPTRDVVRVVIHLGNDHRGQIVSDVTWQPDEEIELPRAYDAAIQVVGAVENGQPVVIGGGGPQLRNLSARRQLALHPALVTTPAKAPNKPREVR